MLIILHSLSDAWRHPQPFHHPQPSILSIVILSSKIVLHLVTIWILNQYPAGRGDQVRHGAQKSGTGQRIMIFRVVQWQTIQHHKNIASNHCVHATTQFAQTIKQIGVE